MQKIKAFTVVELIIAMLLSSIVLSIAYYSYYLLSTQWVKQQKKNFAVSEFQLFKKVFQDDFNKAVLVRDTIEGAGIIFLKDETETIRYLFTNKNVIRGNNEQIDTFQVVGKIEDVNYMNDTTDIISKIQFNGGLGQDKITLLFTKNYSANQLMKLTEYE